MKLTVFRSGKGDCLLLTAQDGSTMLIDGGMSKAYREHVRPSLGELAKSGKDLDLVYVSHIDEDHIAGILKLMEDSVAWRRFDFQQATGNSAMPEPKFPRPPKVLALWHNAFKAQLEDNQGAIEDQLVANARITSTGLALGNDLHKRVALAADVYRNYATSVKQGLQLTRRALRQLKIPINQISAGRLISVEEVEQGVPLGSMDLFVVGPFEADLIKLRKKWNKWLRSNRKAVAKVEKEIKELEQNFPVPGVMDEGQRLASVLRTLAIELGRRQDVTAPNLASLMLLVEENGKRLLLTGDGHAEDLMKGLEKRGKLDANKRLHLDVIKAQHHGSRNNFTKDFLKNITADHYIFCGNGDHHNPHTFLIENLVKTRLSLSADHPQSGKPFKLWFNSSAEVVTTKLRRDHMRTLRKKVELLTSNNGQFSFEFLAKGSKFELEI